MALLPCRRAVVSSVLWVFSYSDKQEASKSEAFEQDKETRNQHKKNTEPGRQNDIHFYYREYILTPY